MNQLLAIDNILTDTTAQDSPYFIMANHSQVNLKLQIFDRSYFENLKKRIFLPLSQLLWLLCHLTPSLKKAKEIPRKFDLT